MELRRRNFLVFGFLLAAWLLVVAWQAVEHHKVKESARTDLRRSSKAIANTVGAFIRGLQFRGAVLHERIDPVLKELVNGSTNELVKSGELLSIELLNAAGLPLASEGKSVDLAQSDIVQEGERWGRNTVIMVYPVEGASVTNSTTILPPFSELTNNLAPGFRGRGFPRHDSKPDDSGRESTPDSTGAKPSAENPVTQSAAEPLETNSAIPAPTGSQENRPHENRPRLPFWARARGMDLNAYQDLIKTRELHGLVLAMSTDTIHAIASHDLWLRCVISFFAGISALGVGLAWGNLAKSSELQIRLVRASELNTHLREMNLAAAGLAHETRNPLNIIRGLAQMISKQPEAPSEIRSKSREIVEESDKVAAQLNEFINYSRPRELRPSALALNTLASEVVRALGYDIEEKKIRVEISAEPVWIQADEQMLRQAMFNLVLNAIQALDPAGQIQILARRVSASEASIEVKDNGPGVPAEARTEIFKPYFTTQQKGTGLGLAIVHQIVLAHGWEIQCVPNDPKGAIFRITHLRLAAKQH